MTLRTIGAARRALGTTAGLLGLTLAVSGCADQGGDDTGAAPPTAGPTTATPTATPSATPAATPSATPAVTGGCPVDPATLFAALKANKKLTSALDARISGLRDTGCHRGYATATTVVPPELADPAFVVFKYNRAAARWTAIGAGTDAVCTDRVPADIIPKLPGCIGS
jgi:hypothetical protein